MIHLSYTEKFFKFLSQCKPCVLRDEVTFLQSVATQIKKNVVRTSEATFGREQILHKWNVKTTVVE